MENFLRKNGIKPKCIDYGNDTMNMNMMKYHSIDKEDKMCSDTAYLNKRKKDK